MDDHDDLGSAGHLEVTPAPGGGVRFSIRGKALAPGDRVEILIGLDEWHVGEFCVVNGRVPSLRIDDITVRIRPFAFLRWASNRPN